MAVDTCVAVGEIVDPPAAPARLPRRGLHDVSSYVVDSTIARGVDQVIPRAPGALRDLFPWVASAAQPNGRGRPHKTQRGDDPQAVRVMGRPGLRVAAERQE